MPSIACNSLVKSLWSKQDPRKITKIKPFIKKYSWEATIHQKKTNGKKLKKIM